MQIVNESSRTYVAWQWKANGGTETSFTESGNNPGGTIQTNTTAGFSIIDYVGTGGAGTIAHGLGKVPEWIVFKIEVVMEMIGLFIMLQQVMMVELRLNS